MKVFIAGASGLVGSALLRSAPRDFQVYFTSRKTLDLENESKVVDYMADKRFDAVILAAAKVSKSYPL